MIEEKVETLEEKKKSKKGLVFIIFLILVIIGLVGYIAYDKGIIDLEQKKEVKEKEENTKKEKEESVEFTDSELEEYVSLINPVNNTSGGPCDLLYDVSSVDAGKLTSAEKIQYIAGNLYKKTTTTSDYAYNVISESDVKKSVEEVYGPNTYEKTTFNLGCADYIFNEKDAKYYSKTGCGGTTVTSASNIIVNYKATKKKLEITTAYAFLDGMDNKIYKDYKKSIVLDNYTDQSENHKSYLDNYVKKNKDKLNHLVYTFESKDGKNYYFTKLVNNK